MIHRTPLAFIALFTLLASCSTAPSTTTTTTQTPTTTETAVDFPTFTPDSGTRLELASNAGLKMSNDGTLSMIFQDIAIHHESITTTTEASDWLSFDRGEAIQDRSGFYVVKLPDGTYKTYGYNPTKGLEGNTCLTSESSTDGVTFTKDSGSRYTLQADDNGTMGVWDVFTTQTGKVILLYIGDMLGKNKVREAVSTDNGETFTFYKDNVLGDANEPQSYVDERSFRMSNGNILLVAMKSGSIYEFLSTDDGETFTVNPTPVLTKDSFPGLNAVGLNDPQLTQLPDGRMRIYATLSIGQPGATPGDETKISGDIVSATSSK